MAQNAGAPKKTKKTKKTTKKSTTGKKKLTGFFAFLGEKREEIKKMLPKDAGVKDIGKKAGELWRSLTESDKKKYK